MNLGIMKKKSLAVSISASSFVFASMSMAAQLEGYATLNNGTTGGAGGEVVYATTGTEINEALCGRASEDTPIIIYVTGTINHANTERVSGSCDTTDSEIQFKRVSNISLIGTEEGALFDEIGIHIREASNIIIQNLHIRNVKKSGSPLSNGGDSIGIEKNVENIWIDHNELEASGGEKDGYDSLLDMKAGTKYVTVSYNYFHNSGRGGLVGSSDSDDANNFITFHHNRYEYIDSRLPLLRHATAHAYNNYYFEISKSGMNPRSGGQIKAENNHFEKVNNAIGTFYTDDIGSWDVSGNKFTDVTWNEDSSNHPAGPNPTSTATIAIPYEYTLHDADCVKSIALQFAGTQSGLKTAGEDCEVTDTPGTDNSNNDQGSSDQGNTDQNNGAEPSVDLQLTLKDGVSVQMDWAVKNTDIEKLEVYRDIDDDPSGRLKLGSLDTTATTFTDTTAIAGTTYYYWVKVYRADGELVNSSPMKIDIPSDSNTGGIPSTRISADLTDMSVAVEWEIENIDLKSVQLYRGEGAKGESNIKIFAPDLDQRSYIDDSIRANVFYTYWLVITNTDDETMKSGTASVSYSSSDDNNSGSDNSGSDNSGSDNSGSDNSGSDNSGSDNSGSDNSGSDNSGSDNSGSDNSGSDNSGSDNSGSDNSDTETNSGSSDNENGSNDSSDSDSSENTQNTSGSTTTITASGSLGWLSLLATMLLVIPSVRRKQ